MEKSSKYSHIFIHSDKHWGDLDIKKILEFSITLIEKGIQHDWENIERRKLLITHNLENKNILENDVDPAYFPKQTEGCYDVISLSPNNIANALYQFAHEYSHYLIDSPIQNYEGRFIWLEESLCELSSYYVLEKCRAENFITDISLDDYNNHVWNNGAKKNDIDFKTWLQEKLPSFYNNTFRRQDNYRDDNVVFARKIYPIFEQNPEAWNIILTFKDVQFNDSTTVSEFIDEWKKQSEQQYGKYFDELKEILCLN